MPEISFGNSYLDLFLYFWWFLLAIFFAFFIPGDLLISKLSLKPFPRIIISLILGMVLWGLQGFIFGYANTRFLSYFYLLACFILWLKLTKREELVHFLNFKIKQVDPLLAITIVLGVIIQVAVLAWMGIGTPKGISFCCGAIGDFIFHMDFSYHVLQRIPPFEFGMAGVEVTNYHYWGNLVVAELVRIFHLPLVYTQFQYLGIMLSVCLGLSAIVFGQLNKLHKNVIRWLVFFLYFSGDLIYLLIFILRKTFDFSMGPLENSASFLNNPPRAFAIVVFFVGLSVFSIWVKRKDFLTGVLMAILFGSLIGFKVYLGFFALSGLAFLGLYFLIKKNFRMLLPLFLALILTLIIYLPVNKSSGGLFYTGFWRFEDFIVQPALGLSHLELARRIFADHYNWLRVWQYELLFAFLFIFSNFGVKLIGLFQTKKSLAVFDKRIHLFLISAIAISFVAGSFFCQQSGGSNSFNFLVSVYIIGSIYAAIACCFWLSKIKSELVRVIVIALIVMVNLPRIGYQTYQNINVLLNNKGYFIDNDLLEAARYIKEKTGKNSTIFEDADSASFQTFLGERYVFLGDPGMVGTHGTDLSARKKIVKKVLEEKDPKIVKKLLQENKIDYLYLSVKQQLASETSAKFLKPVFVNRKIKILKLTL